MTVWWQVGLLVSTMGNPTKVAPSAPILMYGRRTVMEINAYIGLDARKQSPSPLRNPDELLKSVSTARSPTLRMRHLLNKIGARHGKPHFVYEAGPREDGLYQNQCRGSRPRGRLARPHAKTRRRSRQDRSGWMG